MASAFLAWAASRLAPTKKSVPACCDDCRAVPTLCLPGYGILFFHQLGMLAHLRDRGLLLPADGRHEALVGSSAGALAAVVVACGVCPTRAVRAAHALCERAGLYGQGLASRFLRPVSLMGRWGALVRAWLNELLPADAHLRAEAARCRVAVTRVRLLSAAAAPLLSTELLTSFASRDELIDVLAASAHVPLFMDGRLWATVGANGEEGPRRVMDGSLLHLLLGPERGGLLPAPVGASCPSCARRRAAAAPPVVVLDPFGDPLLRASWGRGLGWLRCLSLPTLEGALELVARGTAHAAELERAGAFEGMVMAAAGKHEEDEGDAEAITVFAGGSSASLASSAAAD